MDPITPEQRPHFGELDPVPVCFLQLVGNWYPLKAVRTLEKKKEQKKKIIPFRQNLLGSIWPFPEPIHFFVLGANLTGAEDISHRGFVDCRFALWCSFLL